MIEHQKNICYYMDTIVYIMHAYVHNRCRSCYIRPRMRLSRYLLVAALWTQGLLFAQESPEQLDTAAQEREDPLLGLPEPEVPPVQVEPKIPPRNLFFGIKAARRVIRRGRGRRRIKERFYVLRKKTAPEVPPYVPYVYWYSRSDKEIKYTARNEPRNGPLLHGKYEKKWKKLLIEERFFYHGTPHGRWIWLNTQDILLDKRHYFKGWSAKAEKSYYDGAQTKLREVIPIQQGERSGPYYAFHPNGKIAATGLYQLDKRVKLWREYYEDGRPKREMQYPKDAMDEDLPFIAKEWDRNGKVVYDSSGAKTRGRRRRRR